MRTADKMNWALAAVVVFLTVFVDGEVNALTFGWLCVFMAGTYGMPLFYSSWDRRFLAEKRQMNEALEVLYKRLEGIDR